MILHWDCLYRDTMPSLIAKLAQASVDLSVLQLLPHRRSGLRAEPTIGRNLRDIVADAKRAADLVRGWLLRPAEANWFRMRLAIGQKETRE